MASIIDVHPRILAPQMAPFTLYRLLARRASPFIVTHNAFELPPC